MLKQIEEYLNNVDLNKTNEVIAYLSKLEFDERVKFVMILVDKCEGNDQEKFAGKIMKPFLSDIQEYHEKRNIIAIFKGCDLIYGSKYHYMFKGLNIGEKYTLKYSTNNLYDVDTIYNIPNGNNILRSEIDLYFETIQERRSRLVNDIIE